VRHSSSADGAEGTSDQENSGVIDFVTMPQLCEQIQMSRPAVLRLLQHNCILHYRVGNKIRVKKTELRRFLENGNHPGNTMKNG
jgi:excisionase family DNA binding protein